MIPDIKLDSWEKRSEEHQKQYKYLLQKADKNKVLKLLPELHDAAFEKIDCLREPIKNMREEDKQKVVKYLQNLKKLTDLYVDLKNNKN